MPELLSTYPRKFPLGNLYPYGVVYLKRPEWSCNWYWSFGHLTNQTLFTNLDTLIKEQKVDARSALFRLFPLLMQQLNKADQFRLAEIIMSIYALKHSAELFYRGGSNITENPLKHLIQDTATTDKINNDILPQLFNEMYAILAKVETSVIERGYDEIL